MDPNLSTLERAFQIASSGRCATVTEIKLILNKEGYRHEMIEGPLSPRNSSRPSQRAALSERSANQEQGPARESPNNRTSLRAAFPCPYLADFMRSARDVSYGSEAAMAILVQHVG